MDKEQSYGLTVHDMKDNGKMMLRMDRVLLVMCMATLTLDNGREIVLTVMVNINMEMKLYLKDYGKTMSNMAQAKKYGLIIKDSKDCLKKERKMEKVLIIGKMAHHTLDTGKTIKYMVRACTDGLMDDSMMENGLIMLCMDTAFIVGVTVVNIKANTKMI